MCDEASPMDTLPGGSDLPPSITLARFVACRGTEIQIMRKSLLVQSGSKLAFQTLPKHMRRRTMSHNVKRLPRRLRQIHSNQMKKSGLPSKQKRPSRKYRRRPQNLLEEYTKRAKRHKWLQTHIWHAKRFHMVAKWGYKLPHSPCDKAFRACYRAMAQHCLMLDISYFGCLELEGGTHDEIVERFKKFTLGGRSVGAKMYESGNREGAVTLCDSETQEVIGDVWFHWVQKGAKLWLWVHPAYYDSARIALSRVFQVNEIVDLCRFRLVGPLANCILHDSLITSNEYWSNIKSSSCSDLWPHSILTLSVCDPRLGLPKKRTKSEPHFSKFAFFELPPLSDSPLFDTNQRGAIQTIPDSLISQERHDLLVPEEPPENGAIPIILIQNPGNQSGNLGLGAGWDFIAPRSWGKAFWVSFVMRGARVGGLREFNSILFERSKSQFLQPDTEAARIDQTQMTLQLKTHFYNSPPNKRINFNKLKIVSPFSCNWKLLVSEWGSGDHFTVLRDRKTLNSIQDYLKSSTQLSEFPKNCLIPIRLECEKRGCPKEYAIICLPKNRLDFTQVFEPKCEDKFQKERKDLRRQHQIELKKYRRKRKLRLGDFDLNEYKANLDNYKTKMQSLWLPEPIKIRNSCNREIIGFVTKGGFSFAFGKSAATGFLVSDSLPHLEKFKNRILFRNTNSRQYQTAKISVILE